MMAWHVLATFSILWLAGCSLTQEDPCICLEQFGTEDLYNPVVFTTAHGDDDRIFVVEHRGFIWIYDRDGNRNPEPLLDIGDRFDYAEQNLVAGLLGCAFHPNFQNNRKFYVYYGNTVQDPPVTVVSEFQEDADNPGIADYESERIILEFEKIQRGNEGGELLFGHDDGFLYIFYGESHDEDAAQDMTTHLGKALRIDVDTGDDDIPYLVPEDNPFVDEPGYLPEIYALGFRNPWRCTMDPGDSETGEGRGRIFTGDVGENFCEEVDIVISGGNYAWPVKECIFCSPPIPPVDCGDAPVVSPGEEVLPIHWYTEWGPTGQSITGGHVYRGSALPAYYGDYIYCDWAVRDHGGIQRLREEGEDWENARIPLCDASECGDQLVAEHLFYSFAFGQDQDREMYVVETSNANHETGGGVVYKLVPPSGRKAAP